MENKVLAALMEKFTENGALTNASTGSAFADQFGKAGNYRMRDIDDVFHDQSMLWVENPNYALKFPFYLRLITRKINVMDNSATSTVQRGQGAKDEAFKRLLWIAVHHKDEFYRNLWLLPIVGSWKDLWTLLYYDTIYKIKSLDEEKVFDVIADGLSQKSQMDLVKKFMPRIKTSSKRKTDWTRVTNHFAKNFANYCKISYKEYNHWKTSGTAHDFQKIICARKYDKINWNLIPGRALSDIAQGNFITRHNLDKPFTEWLVNSPTAKFTGYVYELSKKYFDAVRKYNSYIPLYKTELINRQFDELIKKAKDGKKITSNVWCALDTSGSMSCLIPGVKGNICALDVCLSLGIFFSELNEGAFHNNVIMFDDRSKVKQLSGTFTDKLRDLRNSETAWGGTNFQSIVDEIVNVRKKNPNIPLEDYPTTILVVSDMQFNTWERGVDKEDAKKTNYQAMKEKLYTVFPKDFVDSMKFVWWDCISRISDDFPATMDDGGCYFLSGFDGSIISLLLNEDVERKSKKPISMKELIETALNQEILSYVK